MIDKPAKKTWQEEVTDIETYHNAKKALDPTWSTRKTAKELNRSNGAISELIQLAIFLRVYPRIERFINKTDAIRFMQERKKMEEMARVARTGKIHGSNETRTRS